MIGAVFETPRLFVRKCTIEDVDSLQKVLGDPEVMRFSLKGPLDKEKIAGYVKGTLSHYEKHGYGLWALISKEEGKLIGLAGLINQTLDDCECVELIYRIAKDYWGRGLATEVALAIKEFAFTKSGLKRLVSIIEPENNRSRKVAEKIGMNLLKKTLFHGFEVEVYDVSRIVLFSYKTHWQEGFKNEVEKLNQVFTGHRISFHHIGSTSIPACEAKPIVDILGITNDVLQIDNLNGSLERLGYVPLGEYGMKQRRFFRKRQHGDVNLHIFEDSDPEAARHLRFRDYLRSHPQEVAKYSQLKRRLASENPADMVKYILGKESFIKSIDYAAILQDTGEYWNKTIYPRKSTWTQGEIIDALEANMQLQMTYLAKYLPEMQVIYEPDVIVVRSSIRDDTFNYIINTRFRESAVRDRITHVLKLFQSLNFPFSWWVGERDTPDTLEQELVRHGLNPKEDDIGMYLFLDKAQLHLKVPELSIQRVIEKPALKDFATVMTTIGGSPDIYEQFFNKIPPALYAEGAPYEVYVGYLNKEAVVTGILVLHANVGGIYYIMTSPAHRRKGYGTEMMVFLLMRAKERGYHLSTLQASASGRNLYQRLGFEPICRFVEYATG